MASFLEPSALFHHRWSVPVLAELHRTSGSRFVALVHCLGVSPDSLRHTLRALIGHGWVMRNPGYGHPLRPEYILTPAGAGLAPVCAQMAKLLHTMGIEEVGLKKWSMPVMISIQAGHGRFSDLKTSMTGISARALTMTLKDLQAAGLVSRTILSGYPPTARYTLTQQGRKLGQLLEGISVSRRRGRRPLRGSLGSSLSIVLAPA